MHWQLHLVFNLELGSICINHDVFFVNTDRLQFCMLPSLYVQLWLRPSKFPPLICLGIFLSDKGFCVQNSFTETALASQELCLPRTSTGHSLLRLGRVEGKVTLITWSSKRHRKWQLQQNPSEPRKG